MTIENVLMVSGALFAIGAYGVVSRRSLVTVIMSLELMFNGVNVTAVALSRYTVPAALATGSEIAGDAAKFILTGHVFTVFIIVVAAAEVALGLAIIIALYRTKNSVLITEASELKK